MSKLHLGVLGSGAGSNMQSIVDAIEAGTLDADIKLVLADVPDAKILGRAKKHNIPCQYLDCAPWKTKLEGPAEDRCIELLKGAGVDTVVLAGFMRIVKPKLLAAFPNRVLNIHPALLPAFPGVHSWTQALDYGCKVAGVTVHFVDAGTDSGPIIVQKAVPVLEGDTPESLHARIQVQEHIAFPEALDILASGKYRVEGRRVRIGCSSGTETNKEEYLAIIENTLEEVLPKPGERPAELSEAMRYAVGTGGKRIRPLICLASAVAVGGQAEDARYPAAAIELLHNYTLVHDDLPAMDNDKERRGKPTVWTKFGEANAILVGDALQALAFESAANAPRNVAGIIAALGAAGVGVVQGQVEDITIAGAKGANVSSVSNVPDVAFVYTHKTADLFVAAATMGGYAGGGDAASIEKLRTFALNLGLAFQYEDDLLDGDSPYSREKTESLVRASTAAAVNALAGLPGDTSFLKSLAEKLVGRSA